MKELEESLANSFHLKVNILRFISQTLKKYKKRLLRTEWIYNPQLKEQKWLTSNLMMKYLHFLNRPDP